MRVGHVLFERDEGAENAAIFEKAALKDATLTLVPVLLLALLIVLIGVLPGLIDTFLTRAAEDLVNSMNYIESVLSTVGGGL